MANPTWPDSLPSMKYPAAAHGFSDEGADDILRTTMDVGPVKQRPRSTSTTRAISYTTLLSPAQRATEEDFYFNTVKKTLPFDRVDPATQATATWRYTKKTKYTAAGGGYWNAQFALEILP